MLSHWQRVKRECEFSKMRGCSKPRLYKIFDRRAEEVYYFECIKGLDMIEIPSSLNS